MSYLTRRPTTAVLLCLVLGMGTTGRAEEAGEGEAQDEQSSQVEEGLVAEALRDALEEVEREAEKQAKQREDDDPQVAALMKQTRPQYEALLHGRLHAIRDVCDPTPEQEQALLDAGKQAMVEAQRALIRHTIKHFHGNFVVGIGNQHNKVMSPEADMDRVLSELVNKHLDTDQQAKYREEQEKRIDHRRRVCAEIITAAYDSELLLNEEQRQELTESLYTNWNPKWDGCEKSIVYGTRYLPSIPDRLITPLLDSKQLRLWQNRGRHSSMIHMGQMRLVGGEPDCRIAPFQVRAAQDTPPDPEGEGS